MPSKDAVLKQVQAAIEHEANIDLQSHPVAMDFDRGIVTLDGEVPTVGVKKLALGATARVAGVVGINDRLRVDAGPRSGDGATRDAVARWLLRDIDFQNCALHVRVKGQLETLREPAASASGAIEIDVADGVVTLTGQVISLSHKRLAGVLAWWGRGCRDVVNRLEVVPPEEDNDDEIADALRLVLESDPYVHADQIGIGARDHVVTLEGRVSSDGERERAEQDAWCLFAVDKVVNHIEVRAA
ncbi:MAG: BON domain-containing protein [Rhodocyclaceae bacterium]|nr:BON domain-containing protein [Rhodocyclaceae bacterium]